MAIFTYSTSTLQEYMRCDGIFPFDSWSVIGNYVVFCGDWALSTPTERGTRWEISDCTQGLKNSEISKHVQV